MREPRKREWVFMDAGDTFIYGYPTLYDAVMDCWKQENCAIEKEAVKAVVNHFLQENPRNEFHSQERFEQYLRSLYAYILKELRFPGGHLQYCDMLWDEWQSGRRLKLFDDVYPALTKLKDAGFRLGVITNWDTSFERTLKRLDADHFFDVCVVSCVEEIAKPDERIFRLALERADTTPEVCWYLGDHVEYDLKPAKALGMKTVHVDIYQKGQHGELADYYALTFREGVEHILQASLD